MVGRTRDRLRISGLARWHARLAMLPVLVFLALALPVAPALEAAHAPQQPANDATRVALRIAVVDENGTAVPSARISLTPKVGTAVRGETDYAGRKEFSSLVPDTYALHVEKEGFYAANQQAIHVGEVASAEVTLNHTREFFEQVNVVYSPPAIDPAKTQATETLHSEEIINLPYAVTRDIRYALPMLPGVLQDSTGQLHVDGASTRQVYDQIDGFNVSDPATGQFLMRVSVDAVRSVDVATSRYSTELGKGSGGAIGFRTGMGDDHFRMTATDFFPSFQDRRGLYVNSWTPRGLMSGPIRKGKAWFMDALEGEYDQTVFLELPEGADRYNVVRGSNLYKAQANLAQNNNLTVSLLVNWFNSPRSGLDPLDPVSTTRRYSANSFLFGFRDQHLFENGTLLEAGVATSSIYNRFVPQGTQTYVVTPNGTTGNYYSTSHSEGKRAQGFGNLFLPPLHADGKHEFKVGVDVDRLADHLETVRQPYLVERNDGTVSRRVSFTNTAPVTRHNVEASGYVQDRWSVNQRFLVEPGVRFDADEIVHGVAASPRIASTFLANRNGNSKISAGIGVDRDTSNLDTLARSLTGTRTDFFYDASGVNLLQPPVLSTFNINATPLRFSLTTNTSVAFEQKLPQTTYLRLELLDRRARDIWTFVDPSASTLPAGPLSGQFNLTNNRRDHYDSAAVNLRHVFKQNHVVFVSYTRSRALSNADFGYNIDTVLFSPQAGGPLAWDAPNRILSWGWLPITHKVDAAYNVDWRSGFPFTLQNDSQEVVGAPNSQRFPSYFSLDFSLERRFTLLGFQWALRGGVNNITNRANYSYVDSNIDSPHFLTYSGSPGRGLVGRVRLLGRK